MASESSLTRSGIDLEGLSDVEATFCFTNPDDLRRTLRTFLNNARDRDSVGDHTVLITGFPIESFIIDDDDDEDSPIPRSRKALYLEDSKILILTMPGLPHEVAGRLFSGQLRDKLKDMNCLEDTIPTGGVTVSMENVKKEPDESWGPRSAGYPTIALEAAVSESTRALHRDAKIWLEYPESHVTQVITIKIHRTRPEIVFSVWKTIEEQRATRAQYPRRTIMDHEVHVILEHGRPIAGGRVCLSFEGFFERRPRPGTAEHDIVFSARELGGIARVLWEQMGFIPRH